MLRRAFIALFLIVVASVVAVFGATPAGALSADSPYLVSHDGSSYRAESLTTGKTFTGSLKSVVENAAWDLDGSGGGVVRFTAGTFDLGSDYFKPESITNITFEGAGIDTTVIRNSSSASADTEPFNFSGAWNVTIRDLTISAGGAVRSTSDAIDFDQGNDSTVERVKIIASRGRGIVFDGKNFDWTSVNNVIRDCVISNVASDGIELLASSNNVVEGCTITNAGGHGIQLAKSSTSADQPNKKSNDNVITGNVIDNSGQDGINFNGGDRNRIESNLITNSSNIVSSRDGIRIGTGDGVSCNNNVVQGNTATDNQGTKTQRYGLAITSSLCTSNVVSGNDFSGNKTGAILDQGTNTQFPSGGGDTEAPTAPTGANASAISATQVRVTWNAAGDNVGVTGYRVYRNGGASPVGSTGGSTLTFDDLTVAPDTTYSYTVTATDAAGNESAPSAAASATTPPLGAMFTYNASVDSFVSASKPNTNYGNHPKLRVDASPDLRAYVRFNVTNLSGTIASVKLRIYASSSSNSGHHVHTVADNTWGETSINYTNAPAYSSAIGSSGPFGGGAYIEVDVTAVVNGDGTYSFALTGAGSTAISYESSEAAHPPQLVVNMEP